MPRTKSIRIYRKERPLYVMYAGARLMLDSAKQLRLLYRRGSDRKGFDESVRGFTKFLMSLPEFLGKRTVARFARRYAVHKEYDPLLNGRD